MIKNICFMLCFFIPLQALAQVPLDEGEKAPEDGVFLSKEEAAKVIAERGQFSEKLESELREQKEELKIICEGEKKIKDLYLDAEKEKGSLLLDLKQKQIENLYKQLEKESTDYSMWWFVAGATVGTVASVAIFFAATQTDKTPSLLSGN
jgi:hypothetical protein